MRPILACLAFAAATAATACQITITPPVGPGKSPGPNATPEPAASSGPTIKASPKPTVAPSAKAWPSPMPTAKPSAAPSAMTSATPKPTPTRGPDFQAPARQGAEPVVFSPNSAEGAPERPTGITLDQQGNLVVVDGGGVHGRVLRIDGQGGATRIAGGAVWPKPEIMPALDIQLFAANVAARGPGDVLYVSSGGTANTLYRLDGQGNAEMVYHHGNHGIEHVVVDSKGTIYVLHLTNTMSGSDAPATGGPMRYQVVRVDGPAKETVIIPDLTTAFGRGALGIAPDDTLYVAAAGKLQRFTDNGLELIAESGEFSNPAYTLTIDAAGVIHGGTQSSVWRYDPAMKATTTLVNGVSVFPTIAQDAQGHVYFTDPVPGGVYRVVAGTTN